ncbi:MAG: retinol dehydrogenase-12 [Limisphaerales bacterium]|jgi:retinol dehydrogenase-12
MPLKKEKKVALITGATSGIGFATAVGLLQQGYHVVLHGRNLHSVSSAQVRLKAEAGQEFENSIDTVYADLADSKAINEMVDQLSSTYNRLDLLINNAGIIYKDRLTNAEGFEMQFAVNHLAPFRLTKLLSPLLLENAKSKRDTRVINVSSNAHFRGQIDFEDLNSEKNYQGFKVYSFTKLANVLFSNALARQFADTGIRSHAIHPGVVDTGIGSKHTGIYKYAWKLITLFGLSAKNGASTSLHAATNKEAGSASGLYFVKSKAISPSKIAFDLNTQDQLWRKSLSLTGMEDGR